MCGPKGSGKSTFGRLLANRFVTDRGNVKSNPWTDVLILDLDPGQPEFGPPGVISLNKISSPSLSPPFCHPALEPVRSQLRSHAIASVTPALDPTHFIECCLDLVSHYKGSTAHARLPLIINTPGWIQGTGLDILAELVKGAQPTEVIYMSHEGPEETVDILKETCATPKVKIPFFTLPSQPGDGPSSRTSLELRTMQTMSYFHLDWPSLSGPCPSWNPAPLTELRPWRVRYRGAGRGFAGILCYDYQPPPFLVSEYLDGMVLALVKVQNKAAFRGLLGPSSLPSPSPSSSLPDDFSTRMDLDHHDDAAAGTAGIVLSPEGIPLIQNHTGQTLAPEHSRCLGLVLVRGVDAERGELLVLTPVPGDIIAEAAGGKDGREGLVLVGGKFDTPTWSYVEDLHRRAAGGGEGEEDDEDEEGGNVAGKAVGMAGAEGLPYVEILGNRGKAGFVWRVRRDLGR